VEKTLSEDDSCTKILATSKKWPSLLRFLLKDAYPSFSVRTKLSETSSNKDLVWEETGETRISNF
jgi:hypothetical protein